MQYKTLELTYHNGVIAVLTLNRPDVHNAMNSVMMKELKEFWQMVHEKKEIRCVVITGEGHKAFCAGADLKERAKISMEDWRKQRDELEQAMLLMSKCPVPVIAAVNGVAYGGGLELILACDFAYACDTASFCQSEVKLGLIPGAMGTQNFPRAVGLRRAKELTFTGDVFSASEAFEWGVVNRIFSFDALMPSVLSVSEKVAANAPLAIRASKKALNASHHTTLAIGFEFEVEEYNKLLSTQDGKEGIAAFNEKRAPKFEGK